MRSLLLCFLLSVAGLASADLVHHWSLDEKELTFVNGTAPVIDAVAGLHAFVHNGNTPASNPTCGLPGAAAHTGTAIRLNTKFQRIEAPVGQDSFGLKPFSVSFWFKSDAKQDGIDVLVSSDNGGANQWTLELTGDAGSANLSLGFYHRGWGASGAANPDYLFVVGGINPGQWYHTALVRTDADQDNFKIYLDGVCRAVRTNKATFGVDAEKGIWFGRRPNFGVTGFVGLFDDLRIYSSSLDTTAINGLIASTWTGLPVTGSRFVDPEKVYLQWDYFGHEVQLFRVYFGQEMPRNQSVGFIQAGLVPRVEVENLQFDTTYYWQIEAVYENAAATKSPVYSFTTEPVDIPGIVINHSPKATQAYIGSPSIAVLPDGTYIASHDYFGSGTSFNQTVVFESRDAGITWQQISNISGQFWSNLFYHHGALYIFGASGQYGHCIIRRSADGGRTWTVPADSRTGVLFQESNYHTAPMPMVVHGGRIWRAMEDGQAGTAWGRRFRAFVMSAPVDSDLLNADNWQSTNRLGYDAAYLDGQFGGWLEGNSVVSPDGQIVNILRADYRQVPEKAAIIRLSSDGRTATFDPAEDFIMFPGGCKKFVIRHDPISGRYWSLSNAVPPAYAGGNVERTRNSQVLMSSADLRHWTEHKLVLFHPEVSNHGFQYLDWQVEGNDILAVSRTAYDDGMGGADNQHNSNFITFHRFRDFRGPHEPYFVRQPENISQAVHGMGAEFSTACNNGVNDWKWYKVGMDGTSIALEPSERISIQSDASQSRLRIASITAEDCGIYYSTASNAKGLTASQSAELRMYERKLLHHFRLDDHPDWVVDSTSSVSSILDSVSSEYSACIKTGTAETARNAVVFGQQGADSTTGQSILFGGTLERAELGEIAPGRNPFTMAFRFKMRTFKRLHSNQDHILSSNNGQAGRWNVHLWGDNSYLAAHGNLPNLTFWQDGFGGIVLADAVEPERWYSVLLTRNSDDLFRVYLDGILKYSGYNGLDFSNAAGGRGVWLARRPNNESPFDGWIDDVRFYNYVIDDLPDLDGDGRVDMNDLAVFSRWWLATDCLVCNGADLTGDFRVDIEDLIKFVGNWLESRN